MEVYVSNDWGADFDQWGSAVLKELSTEEIAALRAWYQATYRVYGTTDALDDVQCDAKEWVAKSLILFQRIRGIPSAKDEGEHDRPAEV